MYPSDTMKFMQNFVNETKKVRLEDKQEVKDNKILFQIQKNSILCHKFSLQGPIKIFDEFCLF